MRRPGSTGDIPVDVRVLAATNLDPAEALREGRLREDIYFRLNVFEIVVPPPRERLEDLPLLCHHFIREFNRKHDAEVEDSASLRSTAWSATGGRGMWASSGT